MRQAAAPNDHDDRRGNNPDSDVDGDGDDDGDDDGDRDNSDPVRNCGNGTCNTAADGDGDGIC